MEGNETTRGMAAFGTLGDPGSHPGSGASARFGLERLLWPLDPETFKVAYWEKQPLILTRGDRSYYQPLLSLADVDRILAHASIRSSDIRVVRDGQETPVSKLTLPGANQSAGSLEALYQEYRKGSTVVLLFLHERWPPLGELCRSIATALSAGVQVNVYLTPPNARGLQTHYDTHDVFVLQTHGSKRWRIYGSPIRLPAADEPYAARGVDPGEPQADLILESGDLLYIPRGYLHDAASLDTSSLHLTVGIKSVTWASVVLDAVQAVVAQDSRLRESLPPGFAVDERVRAESEARLAELVASVCTQIETRAAIADAANRALLARYPSLEGHLLDLEAEPLVNLDTRVRQRAGVQPSLTRDSGHVYAHFHGKIVSMPAYLEPDLRFMVETGEFSANDLPGELDPEGRLLLVRRLLREGFLTVSRPPA